jgi:hypothetical protein
MDSNKMKQPITVGFNLLLILYILFTILGDYLFDVEAKQRVPWDTVYNMNPVMGILGAIIIMVVFILIGA